MAINRKIDLSLQSLTGGYVQFGPSTWGNAKQNLTGDCPPLCEEASPMASSDPLFTFGKGRNQIVLRGDRAIHEFAGRIWWLLIARAIALLLSSLLPVSVLIALLFR
jgi:hypothetical protein